MKFQYWTTSGVLDTRGRIVKRPMLELEFIGKDGSKINAIGLVDSGADTTMLNIQYADFLGVKLDEKNTRNILGVGNGTVLVYVSTFRFKIKQMEDKEIEVPAWYVDSNNVDILLGQEVFFEMFKIKFEKDHDTFEVTPVRK
ncbi:MAG: retropepsin-like aspartic protease [bacterium]|nr:retropepsin-like aspartic protease [bacterium]